MKLGAWSSVVALGLIASGCNKSNQSMTPPPPAVTANQPSQREVVEWDEYPGRLDAVDVVEVRARVSGYLQSVHFKDGAEVKKGDLLFDIDPRPYQAELDRAEADLRQAETRFELASNDLERAERLLKSKAISEEEADSRNKAKREAGSAIQSAQASVENAKLNVEYAHITAPIDGRIGRKMMTEGNLVNSSQGQSTMLTTIVSMDPIYCYFDAPEPSVLKYQQLAREGKGDNLRDGRVVCELELANETGFPHKGVLDFVDNRVDPGTGTLRVRGILPNPGPDRILQPGYFARLRVPGSAKYPALMIPDQAVGTDQGQKFVYVVNDQDAVEYRTIKLGPLIEGLRVVREGIQPKDWVVVNGLMSIRPGAKVKPDRATPAVAQAATPPPANP
ncbi:MAG TPA: efflux RND transporter periplasmic adaptor subunit [Verrucomicrobiae bacterium]|jgi:multidrug efflux system membrane fusion protein|nr:efflux RND transporter periplasmic adaptor subunit [Verrucomicrobiae bacterium]